MIKNAIKAIPLKTLAGGSFTGSYVVIDAAGLPEACNFIRINNLSNKDILISYDGTTDHDFLLSGTALELDLQKNAQPPSHTALMKQGTKVYVKAAAGTGTVYLSGYYN